ncbi:Hypothetical protein D9617_9g024740 [Elsinoe fawcettii]|nr:Hypothetical protein D9617_9g024740 [Elsinoe fawcettii]
MGAWGYGLFESDQEQDLIDDISSNMKLAEKLKDKVKIMQAKLDEQRRLEKLEKGMKGIASESKEVDQDDKADGEESDGGQFDGDESDGSDDLDTYFAVKLYCPRFPIIVREHLDAGALAHVIKKYSPSGSRRTWTNKQYCLILISACAMELGCTFPPGFINELKQNISNIDMMPEARNQITRACNEYIGGKPYDMRVPSAIDFDNEDAHGNAATVPIKLPSLEIIPSANEQDSETAANNNEGNTAAANDRIIETRFWFPPGTCANCGADKAPDGSDLKHCGDCKSTLYCTAICQTSHYSLHSQRDCDETKAKKRKGEAMAKAKAHKWARPKPKPTGNFILLNKPITGHLWAAAESHNFVNKKAL